jgi:hypothetical protein
LPLFYSQNEYLFTPIDKPPLFIQKALRNAYYINKVKDFRLQHRRSRASSRSEKIFLKTRKKIQKRG